MNFDSNQPDISSRSHEQQQNPQDPLGIPSQRVDEIQRLEPVGVVGDGMGSQNGVAATAQYDRIFVDPNPVVPVLQPTDVLESVGVADTQVKSETGVGIVDSVPSESAAAAAAAYYEDSGPKQKRMRTDGMVLEGSSLVECGQPLSVYSTTVPPVPSQQVLPPAPRKRRAGLRKSTDTRKNNNRIALRDFTCGRRCVTDVVAIDPPMVAHIKVVNGVSTDKVLRKNKKSMLIDVGQQFGVLQLFVEGHPKSDEKVWVTTSKGVVPVSSTAVQNTMTQLTISVRDFPVIARGRVRRDPQKQGTRPKPGEPIVDCYAVYVGDEGKPLWVESSLISVEPSTCAVAPSQPVVQQQPLVDQNQLPIQAIPPTMTAVDTSSLEMPVTQQDDSLPSPRP